jgi:hypothetical protein
MHEMGGRAGDFRCFCCFSGKLTWTTSRSPRKSSTAGIAAIGKTAGITAVLPLFAAVS